MRRCGTWTIATPKHRLAWGTRLSVATAALLLLALAACDEGLPRCRPSVYKASNISTLETAVWDGNVEAVRRLVKAGADVDARDPNGTPLLFRPAGRGCSYDVTIVEILIDAGADVNATDANGDPVLHYAAWQRQAETARILIDAGADVNATDGDGDPLLHETVWRDIPGIARILIDAGADVNATDASGDPLLHEAIWRGYADMARILIDAGADVNATGRRRRPPPTRSHLSRQCRNRAASRRCRRRPVVGRTDSTGRGSSRCCDGPGAPSESTVACSGTGQREVRKSVRLSPTAWTVRTPSGTRQTRSPFPIARETDFPLAPLGAGKLRAKMDQLTRNVACPGICGSEGGSW